MAGDGRARLGMDGPASGRMMDGPGSGHMGPTSGQMAYRARAAACRWEEARGGLERWRVGYPLHYEGSSDPLHFEGSSGWFHAGGCGPEVAEGGDRVGDHQRSSPAAGETVALQLIASQHASLFGSAPWGQEVCSTCDFGFLTA